MFSFHFPNLLKSKTQKNLNAKQIIISNLGYSAKSAFSSFTSPCSAITVASVARKYLDRTRVYVTSPGFCFVRKWVYFSKKSLRVHVLPVVALPASVSTCLQLSGFLPLLHSSATERKRKNQMLNDTLQCWPVQVGVAGITAARWISHIQTRGQHVNITWQKAVRLPGFHCSFVCPGWTCDPIRTQVIQISASDPQKIQSVGMSLGWKCHDLEIKVYIFWPECGWNPWQNLPSNMLTCFFSGIMQHSSALVYIIHLNIHIASSVHSHWGWVCFEKITTLWVVTQVVQAQNVL